MKEILISQFDESDFNKLEMLKSLGVNRNVAHVLVFMSHKKDATGKEIEIASGLRQPQVSIAAKKLNNFGYIKISHPKKDKNVKIRSRARNIYNLNISIMNILLQLENRKFEEYNRHIATINTLKDIFKEE